MRANKLETALSRDRSYSLSCPTRYVFFMYNHTTTYCFSMYLSTLCSVCYNNFVYVTYYMSLHTCTCRLYAVSKSIMERMRSSHTSTYQWCLGVWPCSIPFSYFSMCRFHSQSKNCLEISSMGRSVCVLNSVITHFAPFCHGQVETTGLCSSVLLVLFIYLCSDGCAVAGWTRPSLCLY